METKHHRVITLANQPHEAEFITPIVNELFKLDPRTEISLAFTDYYVFLSQQNFLSGIKSGFPGEVVHLGEMYKSWQEEEDEPDVDDNFLKAWEHQNCSFRTLHEIERTNQLVFLEERSQWYTPINDAWKKKILIDTIKWCENYIERFKPTVFVSVGNATLVTNVMYTLAERTNIPFYNFLPSRIGNRILVREDFGYGMSDSLFNEIIALSDNNELRKLALNVAIEVSQNQRGSYESYQMKISEDFSKKRSNLIRALLSDIRRLIGQIYARLFIQKRLYAFPIKRIKEDLFRLTLYDFRRIFRQYFRSLGLLDFGRKTVPEEKYMLWALHMRPEGAISTLGDGKDEIVELLKCADLLPRGYFMAVKENPEMFGQRKRGFHRNLKRHPKVILLDPYSPIFPLISSSIGVIGISGTVLMEAAILNKPSCALGHPEFDRFLTEYGWESAKSFIEKCTSGVEIEALEKFLPYLCYVIDTTDERDTPPWHDWLESFDPSDLKLTHVRLARQIAEKLSLF